MLPPLHGLCLHLPWWFELPGARGTWHMLEERLCLLGSAEQLGPGQPQGGADVTHLVILITARVEGPAQMQLSHHTAQRPHVHLLTEGQPQQDLGGPVEAGLDVGLLHVAHLREEDGRAKVNQLDAEWVTCVVHQHDVLWFKVSVDDGELLQLGQGQQHLRRDGADVPHGQRGEVVLLLEVKEVLLQQLEDQVGPEGVTEGLEEVDDVRVLCVPLPQGLQQPQLIVHYLAIVITVLQDLDSHHVPSAPALPLDHLSKGPLPHHGHYVIALCTYH